MGCSPGPREQLIERVDWVASDESGEDICEGLRIDAIQFAGFDERSEDGPVLAAAIGASEQRVLAIEGERADGALDGVGVDLGPRRRPLDGCTRPLGREPAIL
jgi:hypothetical protein